MIGEPAGTPQPIGNAVTVDVEDWIQSVVDPDRPLTRAFEANTHRVLEAFDRGKVRGTFFVLGLAAEKAPGLVRAIHDAGHEVQSHGYGHRLIHKQTVEAFRTDVRRAKDLLEDIIGAPVTGYRAPAFSIGSQTLWALDVLAECGYRYDSSIFPIAMPRYGIGNTPVSPYRVESPQGSVLTEVPVATWRMWRWRLPVGGGGYFRLLPYSLLRRGIGGLNAAGYPAIIYMHPYEFAPGEFGPPDYRPPLKMRLHQGLGRRRFSHKVDRLLEEFNFGRIEDLLAGCTDWPVRRPPVIGGGIPLATCPA